MTRAERAEAIRSKAASRARYAHRPKTTRDVGPLPMSERFWRDVDVMHARLERLAEAMVGRPRPLRRDMEQGVR